MIVGFNGAMIEEKQAVVSVFDHGFLYGIGLFETFRTYGGVPVLLNRHMDRLSAGCKELGIDYQPDVRAIGVHIQELLAANGLADGYVRFSVSAGEQPLGLPSGEYDKPNTIIYVKPLAGAAVSREGKTLQLLRLRRNTPEGPQRTKSFHYMNNVLAKRELSGSPHSLHAEGLFLDGSGYIAEGIVSNLFFTAAGRLYTPSLAAGILPGITRNCVLELSAKLGIETEEGLYDLDKLTQSNEIFLTNSVQELVPVQAVYDVDHRMIWTAEGGSMTSRLQEAYARLVSIETGFDGKEA